MKKNALLSFFLIKLNSLTSKRQNVTMILSVVFIY